MPDRYQQLVNTPVGRIVSKQVGLPNPPRLERYVPGQPVIDGPVLLGAAPGARIAGALAQALASIGAEVVTPMSDELRTVAAKAKLDPAIWNPDAATEDQRFKALVFDASGIETSHDLEQAWAFLHPTIRRVTSGGRVIVLGTPPEACDSPPEAVAQRALEGLVRSIGKEVGRGATAQLIYVRPKAESGIESTIRFFLSPKSAYVSGQVVRVGRPAAVAASGRLGEPAGRQGGARHRRRPWHRRRHRRGPRSRRSPCGRARRAADGQRAHRWDQPPGRLDARRRHHRARRRRARSPSTCSSITAASTSSSTTRA